jgi:hypothetical protein
VEFGGFELIRVRSQTSERYEVEPASGTQKLSGSKENCIVTIVTGGGEGERVLWQNVNVAWFPEGPILQSSVGFRFDPVFDPLLEGMELRNE